MGDSKITDLDFAYDVVIVAKIKEFLMHKPGHTKHGIPVSRTKDLLDQEYDSEVCCTLGQEHRSPISSD